MAMKDKIMGLLKQSAGKTQDVLHVAAKQTEKAIDSSKTMLAIASKEREIEKKYMAIGEKYARKNDGNFLAEMDVIVEEIKLVEAEIAILKESKNQQGKCACSTKECTGEEQAAVDGEPCCGCGCDKKTE